MADDAILPEGTPTPVAPAVTREEHDKLARSIADVAREVTQGFQALRNSVQPPNQQPLPPEPAPDAFLDEFVKDGRGTMVKVVKDVVRETVGPWAQAQAVLATDQLTNAHRETIDKTYGPGTWDEVIAPAMDTLFNQLDEGTRPIARANKASFETILRQAKGTDDVMEKLQERREVVKRQPAPDTLGDSRIPSNQKPKFSTEDQEWMAAYEKSSGTSLDKKTLLNLIQVKQRNGGVLTLDEMRQARQGATK